MKIKKDINSLVAIYDNGGKSFDRYTAVFLTFERGTNGLYQAVGMSEDPYHPQGFGQHTEVKRGRHLGKRIEFKNLPAKCRKLVKSNLK